MFRCISSNYAIEPKNKLKVEVSGLSMEHGKWTKFLPVVLVLVLSIPIVTVAQWTDFKESRRLADSIVDSSGFFSGFSESTTTTVDLIPDSIIDSTVSDAEENITITDSEGNVQNVTQDTGKKSIINAVITTGIMLGVAVAAAFGIFMLFRKKKKVTLKMIFAISLGLCSSVSIMLYLYLLRLFLNDVLRIGLKETDLFYGIIIGIGAVIGIFIVYNMVFRALEPKRKNPALIAFCVALGPFLAIVLPVWVVVFLLAGVALWDLWAAKRGIIKKMINLSDEHRKEDRMIARKAKQTAVTEQARLDHQTPTLAPNPPVTPPRRKRKKLIDVGIGEDITSYGLYEGKHFALGIGDFIFFSVLVSATFKWMMLKLPWMEFYAVGWGELLAIMMTILVMTTVMIGFKQTLSFLETENVMPGLPISVLWGLITFFAAAIFVELINVIGYGVSPVNPF
jgi:MFS family permease